MQTKPTWLLRARIFDLLAEGNDGDTSSGRSCSTSERRSRNARLKWLCCVGRFISQPILVLHTWGTINSILRSCPKFLGDVKGNLSFESL